MVNKDNNLRAFLPAGAVVNHNSPVGFFMPTPLQNDLQSPGVEPVGSFLTSQGSLPYSLSVRPVGGVHTPVGYYPNYSGDLSFDARGCIGESHLGGVGS